MLLNEEAYISPDREQLEPTLNKIIDAIEILTLNNLNLVLAEQAHGSKHLMDSLAIFPSEALQLRLMNALCLCFRNCACTKQLMG